MKRFSKMTYQNVILSAIILVILANGYIQTVSSIKPVTLWAFACFSYATIKLIGSMFTYFFTSIDVSQTKEDEDFLF